MASSDVESQKQDEASPDTYSNSAMDNLAVAVANVSIQLHETTDYPSSKMNLSRPLRVYTRPQVLLLHRSPLVKPPDGMPVLKDWFGDWNEQVATKKDSEASSASASARERRFRRDLEDGDSTRSSFRSTLSQPSQMGNFRHQSIRTSDRDRERDLERERERDLRDKEGQERLRNLSDKYDRDRLAMSATSNSLRKERDSAPHLTSGAPSRLGQSQGSATLTRRTEARDAPKRKAGESSDDWRRVGPDPARSSRDDRSDNSRRARESSRSRREPSSSRRDRDRDRDEKDRDRARDRRTDADRDDHRRDKDDYSRRDRDDHRREWDDFYNRGDRDDALTRDPRYRQRDADRDADDDPRRWRDDGKRDERMVARRERERDRDRERGWERSDDRDRDRLATGDDRDPRSRRGAARERRAGVIDDARDREDRRERDKDKEAEPAWMETYIPTTPGGGILGGKSGDGELDGIQAWKKGMKEKERKEKENGAVSGTSATHDGKETASNPSTSASTAPENTLDEIQLFKLMMKREAEKKGSDGQLGSNGTTLADTAPPNNEPSSLPAAKADGSARLTSEAVVAKVDETSQAGTQSSASDAHLASQQNKAVVTAAEGAQPLLSLLTSSIPSESSFSTATKSSTPSLEHSLDGPRLLSNVIPNSLSSALSSSTTGPSTVDHSVPASATSSTFNPPPGSRLLAFGARAASGGPLSPDPKTSAGPASSVDQFSPGLPILAGHKPSEPSSLLSANPTIQPDPIASFGTETHFGANLRHTPIESSRMRSFSPHNPLAQSTYEEMGESPLGQFNDPRRVSAVERAAFGLPNEGNPAFTDLSGAPGGMLTPGGSLDMGSNIPGNMSYAAGKGSRFAKFFDTKTRDGQPLGGRKGPGMPGYPPGSIHPELRQGGMNGLMGNGGETRTIDDVVAMLQNSAQSHRVSPQITPSGRMPPGGTSFAQSHNELQSLQQMHTPPHFPQNNHIESLYDSRLDDRNFVPDGMVPGLRPAPPRSRSREPSGVLFNEQIDDPLHFNVRLQQQRNLEQMFPNAGAGNMYTQQQAAMLRNGGLPLQQQQFRGAPSPISNQNTLGGPPQRLPPGLANLGGRPPHDPSQYLGSPVGGLGGGLQGGLHNNGPAQQAYNFSGNGLAYGGPQVRGPVGPQNPMGLNSMGNLGLQSNVDLRAANQAQLLALNGGLGGGLRGQGPAFGGQHGLSGQLPGAPLGLRQQQQQLPHLMAHQAHLLPPNLQQQHGVPGGGAQTQDLMALLMGGHRD